MIRRTLAALVFLFPVAAGAQSLDEVIDEAASSCESYNSGQFSVEGPTAAEIDLTGDGVPEVIADEAMFYCSSSASLYSGTGGSMLHAWVDGQRFDWLVKDWEVLDQGGTPVLLLRLSGGECSAAAQPCFEALTWGDGRFLSVRTPD
jgi:hypothetical protein